METAEVVDLEQYRIKKKMDRLLEDDLPRTLNPVKMKTVFKQWLDLQDELDERIKHNGQSSLPR